MDKQINLFWTTKHTGHIVIYNSNYKTYSFKGKKGTWNRKSIICDIVYVNQIIDLLIKSNEFPVSKDCLGYIFHHTCQIVYILL